MHENEINADELDDFCDELYEAAYEILNRNEEWFNCKGHELSGCCNAPIYDDSDVCSSCKEHTSVNCYLCNIDGCKKRVKFE